MLKYLSWRITALPPPPTHRPAMRECSANIFYTSRGWKLRAWWCWAVGGGHRGVLLSIADGSFRNQMDWMRSIMVAAELKQAPLSSNHSSVFNCPRSRLLIGLPGVWLNFCFVVLYISNSNSNPFMYYILASVFKFCQSETVFSFSRAEEDYII